MYLIIHKLQCFDEPLGFIILSLTHLLEVADPVQPPGSHIGSEAVGVLSSEHSQTASVRPIHPRLLYRYSVLVSAADPEHQAGRTRESESSSLSKCIIGSSFMKGSSSNLTATPIFCAWILTFSVKNIWNERGLEVKQTSPQVWAPALMAWCFCSAVSWNFSHQPSACRSTLSSDWSRTGVRSANHRLDPWFQVPLL